MHDIATYCANKRTQERATLIGYAAMVLMQSPKYSLFQILTIRNWVEQAIDLGQIKFFFDWDGSPIGFITWGFLAADVQTRLINDRSFSLHFSEWNEGGNFWVIDFCMPSGSAKEALSYFLDEMASYDVRVVSWARRNADYSVRKICTFQLIDKKFSAKILK